MKKILALILAALMVLTMFACAAKTCLLYTSDAADE